MNSKIILPAILLTSCTAGAAVAKKSEQPNIIFILADDMGIGDLGCYGQQAIPTPNIDRLSQNGIEFSRHYSGSTVSAPSRCVLMTGKHTGHSHVRGNKAVKTPLGTFDNPLPDEQLTVAEIAKKAGYATVCVGKWALGGPETSGSPINQGYDYFFGYLSQTMAHDYYPDHLWENETRYPLDGETYSHFLIMEKGLDFIRKNDDKPIFAYFAITPPHADLDYPDISEFEGKFDEKPYINKSTRGGYKSQENPRATYAAMVAEVDKNVGQVIDLLEERGEIENSIIIFSSDNGVHAVGGHDPNYFNSNGEYRGYKRDLYEGGIRTPFVVRWDKEIAAGSKTDHISTFWDFLPTVCDIVGAKTPKDTDGISYLPTLLGKGRQKTHDYLYYEFFEMGGKQAVLKDDWKLIRLNINNSKKTREELYNLNEDMGETTDLIDKYPERAAELRELMDNTRTESELFKFNIK